MEVPDEFYRKAKVRSALLGKPAQRVGIELFEPAGAHAVIPVDASVGLSFLDRSGASTPEQRLAQRH